MSFRANFLSSVSSFSSKNLPPQTDLFSRILVRCFLIQASLDRTSSLTAQSGVRNGTLTTTSPSSLIWMAELCLRDLFTV